MAKTPGELVKVNSDGTTFTSSGVFTGTISDVFTPTMYFSPLGIILPNYSVSGDTGALYFRKVDGTPQVVLTINSNNNLDIGVGGGITYMRFSCSLILRPTYIITGESADITQDLPIVGLDGANNLHLGNSGVNGPGANQSNDTYFDVLTGKSQFFTENQVKVAGITGSKLGVRTGLVTVPVFCNVGGSLFDDYADAATTSTNGTEDDLYSHTALANTLASNGDKITFVYTLTTVSSATATRKIKVYFAGTAIFDSTAQVTASAAVAVIRGELIRVSSTVVRYSITPSIPGMVAPPAPAYGELTGLTLSANTILKVTGAAAGTGAAASDIVARMSEVFYTPAATAITVPLSLFPVAWLKADAGTYQTVGGVIAAANNDPVGYWVDQGLSGNSISQATAGNRPLLQTNYQNSLPSLLFDGTSDFLKAAFTLNQPYSVYAVMKNITTKNNCAAIGSGVGGNARFLFGSGGNSFFLYAGAVGGGGQAFSNGTTYTFRGVFNGASSATALNSGSPTTGNTNAGAATGLSVGGDGDGTGLANVAVMEVLVFDRVLSGAEETLVLDYLRTKWNHY